MRVTAFYFDVGPGGRPNLTFRPGGPLMSLTAS